MSPNPQLFAQDCCEKELPAICEGLFVPQGDHGINAHRAACGDIAREKRDGEKHSAHDYKPRGIGCRNAEEQRGEQARQSERAGDSDADAKDGQSHEEADDGFSRCDPVAHLAGGPCPKQRAEEAYLFEFEFLGVIQFQV